jgi:hypothetical protein
MMPSSAFRPNPRARVALRRLGREGLPLAIIDDAFLEPEALVREAEAASFIRPSRTVYPGLNAPPPVGYGDMLIHVLRPLLDQVFGVPTQAPLRPSSFFALATLAPERLDPVQKVPHHDSSDPFVFATVHFLCRGEQGGTAFYRHVPTRYEYVDAERVGDYASRMRREVAAQPNPAHAGPDTPNYELIDEAPAVFNRVILYRGISLHSGLLGQSSLSPDPRSGRLTLNTLISPARARRSQA